MTQKQKGGMKNIIDDDVDMDIEYSEIKKNKYEKEKKMKCKVQDKEKGTNKKENKQMSIQSLNKKSSKYNEEVLLEDTIMKRKNKKNSKRKNDKKKKNVKKEENVNQKNDDSTDRTISLDDSQLKIAQNSQNSLNISNDKTPFTIKELETFYSTKEIHLNAKEKKYLSKNSEHIIKLYNFIEDNEGIDNVLLNSLLDKFIQTSNYYNNIIQCQEDYDTYLSLYYIDNHDEYKKIILMHNPLENPKIESKYFLDIPRLKSFPLERLQDNFCYLITNLFPTGFQNSFAKIISRKQNFIGFKCINLIDKGDYIFNVNHKKTSEIPKHGGVILMSLEDEIPEMQYEIKKYIPEWYLPKSGYDILKYSPINVSGINKIRIMVVTSDIELTNFFGKRKYIQFKRLIVNLGPGRILHYVIESKLKEIPKPSMISPSYFCSQEVRFYNFIQKPGDIIIVEQGNYLISFTMDKSVKTHIVNWCQLTLEDKDITSIFRPPNGVTISKIPIITTLMKILNYQMKIINIDYLKIFLTEFLKYKSQVDNINDYLSLFVKKKFYLIHQQKNENVNFCQHCKMEIFNYYCIINRLNEKAICFKCLYAELINPKENYEHNVIIYYKLKQKDIDLFLERLSYFISNPNSSINKNLKNYYKPQVAIDEIKGANIPEIYNRRDHGPNEFIYSTLSELKSNNPMKVSKSLLSFIDANRKKIEPLDFSFVNAKAYVNYKGNKDNLGMFSPRYEKEDQNEEKDDKGVSSFNHNTLKNLCSHVNIQKENKDRKRNEVKKNNYSIKYKSNNKESIYEHLFGEKIG